MKKKLISIDVSIGTYREQLLQLTRLGENHRSSFVCVANVHMLVEAHKDASFAAVVNSADMVTPDGMPLAKGIKLLHGISQERVAGMDLLPDLLSTAGSSGISVFFYGGTRAMLNKTKEYCANHFPLLRVAGLISPPFRPLSEQEKQEDIAEINASGAGFVFVALGCPKQEKWMAAMHGRVHACMIGIGGALPVMIGLQKRAPVWMQKMSLEWLYRLLQEPKRLFKRYAITNTVFIYLFFKQWSRQGFRPVAK
ncbi:WecB/TagA/CpsF family glycosyltransferase [Niabella ginsenosidivorans]|nr:WecB/TagA/CpsF family glycosyltransferase [Niabella ginsenosidivorans]